MTAESGLVAVYTDTDDTDISLGRRMLEDAGFEVRVLGTRDPQEIIARAGDADVLLLGYAHAPRIVIESLPRLRLIACMSMGFDVVDLDAATERGVWVSNVPGAATEEVATHALALILHAVRQLPFYLRSATTERWNERAPQPPRRLSEMTLGLVGLGKIGRELARIARPLFTRVVGTDPFLPDNPEVRDLLKGLGIERTSLESVRTEADVLSLHLPLTTETEAMIDADFLAAMPRGAVLVNVSRGGLLDVRAVADSLDSGRLSAAALDVLNQEPPAKAHPLVGRDDVVLTPHIAYFSNRTDEEYVRIQARNAIAFAENARPESPVNEPIARRSA